mmetsp:Transcript_42563/g.52402  ORF Transcript_42563/g.52402 Transcript_42563/m.52402 type:complete len:98 (-) Transcript_42563:35-328(-)
MNAVIEMTDNDLKRIGIAKTGHRIKIMKAIQKYKQRKVLISYNNNNINLKTNNINNDDANTVYSFNDDEKESRYDNDIITDGNTNIGDFQAINENIY